LSLILSQSFAAMSTPAISAWNPFRIERGMLSEGADLHEHSHPNEEIWHVIEGDLEVTTGGVVERVGPGYVAMVPPDTLHSVKVISAGRVIVVDHPRRESIQVDRYTERYTRSPL